MRKAEVILEYQPYVDYHPQAAKQLFEKATENDAPTIKFWKDTWIKNVRDNHKTHGPFAERSIGKLFGHDQYKPVIIIGSGPSLKHNAHELKNKGDVTTISCLHNFHFLEDQGVPADFYVSLDAGEIVVEEVYEGGKKTPQEYWEITKNRKLLCYIGTSPQLLEKWQGEIYFFNSPIPDEGIIKAIDDIELFNTFVSTGGNVLGACLYIARSHFGAAIVAFMGADFSFGYDHKFHGWDSKYDANMGNVIKLNDVFGIPVKTWQSYNNFKGWFESISMTIPGIYFNCSEGGTLGAYPEGNIRSIIQKPISEFLRQMNMYEEIKEQALNPKVTEKKLLF